MFKTTPYRVLAKLCLNFSFCAYHDRIQHIHRQRRFRLVLYLFFRENPPEMVRYFTLLISQCWRLNDCKIKSEVSEKDVTVFLSQLNDLITAAYRYHQSFCDIIELRDGGLRV